MSDEKGKDKQESEKKSESIISSSETKKKKAPRQVKTSTFASSLAGVIIIALVLIGGFYYLQTKASSEHKDQAVDQVQNEMQAEIDELNKTISDLEEKDKTKTMTK